MNKRNKRGGFWKGLGIGALIALVFGCGPSPSEPPRAVLPACSSVPAVAPAPPTVNRIYQPQLPCRPGTGQRVLVYLENDGRPGSRTATCNAIGGTPVTSDQAGWDACDYVDVDLYVLQGVVV